MCDEIHQLRDPTRLRKIGADVFPKLKILATGSSTLAASRKFRDTLTGRKRLVHLTPVLFEELPAFGGVALGKRLLHGGLPPALLAEAKRPSFYREWVDSFFARDVQALFGFRDVIEVFRRYYPKGRNYLVRPSSEPAYTKRYGKLEVRVCTPTELHS